MAEVLVAAVLLRLLAEVAADAAAVILATAVATLAVADLSALTVVLLA